MQADATTEVDVEAPLDVTESDSDGMALEASGDFATQSSELLWDFGETWNLHYVWRGSTDAPSARQSHLASAVGMFMSNQYPGEYCSSSLISRSRLMLAAHCILPGTTSRDVFFGTGNQPQLEADLRLRLRQLGFPSSGSLLDDAVDDALEDWLCNISMDERSSQRDMVYAFCNEKVFQIQPGHFVRLHPGEIFGHLDVTTAVPSNNTQVQTLAVNDTSGMSLTLPSVPIHVLLSPNGIRRTGTSQTCGIPYFQGCRSTQGDDTMKGSSGGASLVRSTSRQWGVLNGFWSDGSHGDPELFSSTYCWSGSSGSPACNSNYQSWTPFNSDTLSLQYSPRVSSLVSGVLYSTVTVGGSGGSAFSHRCEHDEAMVGIVGSIYEDQWNSPSSPLVLGNFGAICGPVKSGSARYLQLDYATVRTATSYDTGFATSLDGGAYPPRLNRYQSTIFSTGNPATPHARQSSFVCPSGYSVSGMTVGVAYNKVRRIQSVSCRSVFNTSSPEIIYGLSSTEWGQPELAQTTASISCTAGTYGSGVDGRSGWFTDRLQLICRD